MNLGQYKARLARQAQSAPSPLLNGVPILLEPNEVKTEDNNEFIRWVHRERHLSSMLTLRNSAKVLDARLERKLRCEYAKL